MLSVHADPLPLLRARTSEKWSAFPADVLPLFVAEMDYPLAPPVAEAMIARVRASDTGYVGGTGPLAPAFADYAQRTWGWMIDPGVVRTTTDVSVAITEVLRVTIRPGDRVIVTPPVYPPFYDLIPEAGGIVERVPLLDDGTSYALDLVGIEAALAAGARAILLCSPHNPLGHIYSREQLAALADLAVAYGAAVVSDEIHGPLTHAASEFVPFLAVSDAAREVGVCVTSASKGWNLAGTKAAIMVPGTPGALDSLPIEVGFRTSILGLHASIAAYSAGEEWLAGAVAAIEYNAALLTALLAEHLPEVGYRPPSAGYLAWLDARALGWGDDPSVHALKVAKVALNPGPSFGEEGTGFVRLNLACSPEVLTEAIERLAAAR